MGKALEKQEVQLVAIGNSKGIRLPKRLIQRYRFSDSLILEERKRGVLLRNQKEKELSWEETYQQMATEKEDWGDLEQASLEDFDLE